MLEVLSTIGLTASAAIVIGFLAYAMAETPRGRLTVAGVLIAWFALVVTVGASAALDPVRGFGVPALGLTVGLPVAALVSAFFAFGPIRAAHAGGAFTGAGRGECDPNPPRVAVCPSLCRGQTAGAVRAERRLGRHFRRRRGAAPRLVDHSLRPTCRAARFCVERHRDRRSRQRDRAWRPISAGSASDLHRSADERHHDHPALAHRSWIPGAEPDFHSRRHCLSATRQVRSLVRRTSMARRRPGKADLKRAMRPRPWSRGARHRPPAVRFRRRPWRPFLADR